MVITHERQGQSNRAVQRPHRYQTGHRRFLPLMHFTKNGRIEPALIIDRAAAKVSR